MATPDPCRSRCYDLVGAPSRDATFQNTKTGTAATNCLTACDADIPIVVGEPTLARVLVAGNTTSDLDNLAGNPIIGNEYTLDLDASPSGFTSSLPITALPGVALSLTSQSSTTGGGANFLLTAGAATVTGNGGILQIASGDAGVGGQGGELDINAGGALVSGNGGDVSIGGGFALSGNGGLMTVFGGTSIANGHGGDLALRSGQSSNAVGPASHVEIKAGNVLGPGSTAAGDILLVPSYNGSAVAQDKKACGSIGIDAVFANDLASAHFVAHQFTVPGASSGEFTTVPHASDMAGTWTGAATPTVTISFQNAYASFPFVVVSPNTAVPVSLSVTAVSSTDFTVTSVPDVTSFTYICIGGTFV